MKSIKNRKWKVSVSLLLLSLVFSLSGCAAKSADTESKENEVSTKVVLTTGFNEEEVFRISKSSCTLPEIMVYLTNMQDQYENVYGTGIWDTNIDGVTLEQKVKDTVIARIAQVKTMALLAESYEVTLSEKEKKAVETAAQAYYESLNETEITKMDITEDTIVQLYTEFALANRVYDTIIQDVNPEISDDEARTITVQQILIRTYNLDENGNRVEYTESQKTEAYKRAENVLKEAKDGTDFAVLAEKYSEDGNVTYSFGKGEMEAAFEEAAFNLGNEEISDIVQTQYGYYIIKCVSTFDVKQTDANKEKIVEQRKKEAFNEVYDRFVSGLTRNLNNDLWDSVEMIPDEEVTTSDFFTVFDQYFSSLQKI